MRALLLLLTGFSTESKQASSKQASGEGPLADSVGFSETKRILIVCRFFGGFVAIDDVSVQAL